MGGGREGGGREGGGSKLSYSTLPSTRYPCFSNSPASSFWWLSIRSSFGTTTSLFTCRSASRILPDPAWLITKSDEAISVDKLGMKSKVVILSWEEDVVVVVERLVRLERSDWPEGVPPKLDGVRPCWMRRWV